MKFIRNYIKKLIIEAVTEGFPPINIIVSEGLDTDLKLYLVNGVYNKSTITITKTRAENVVINGCTITAPDEGSFFTMNTDQEEKK